MYSVQDYGAMIADGVRMDAYIRALEQVVNKDTIVIDIGTGVGIFALLACKYGARHVVAIETNDAIQVAMQLAQENGYAEKIEFIQADSAEVSLAEKGDVIISDLRGQLPIFGQHIASIIDARTRFLAPGGVLIPQRDQLWVAVIEAPAMYDSIAGPWDKSILNMRAAKNMVLNSFSGSEIEYERMLTQPSQWAELDYRHIENPDIQGTVVQHTTQAGTGHGLLVWFDACLYGDIGFSNSPGHNACYTNVYGRVFLPWLSPVHLEQHDRVQINIQADLIDGEYVWQWNTRIDHEGQQHKYPTRFRQSTFFGSVISIEQIQKRTSQYIPQLSNEAAIDLYIMSMMAGIRTSESIAEEVLLQYPTRFCNLESALMRVRTLSEKCST